MSRRRSKQGRDPVEARRSFGSALRTREASRDVRLAAWLDSLRADAVFGWRQLVKKKVTSAAAVLSLALAIGACTSAFRLIDALLLRPLPVAHPERLYSVVFEGAGVDGKTMTYDSCSYPMFRQMRAATKDQAELMAVSYADRSDLTYRSDQETERAYRQFVSGWMFQTLGLRPAAGRLFTENDDVTPGAHPVAVLSHDYWTRRFARDPKRGRTDLPDGRRPVPDCGCRGGALHRNRNRHRHRYLPADDDEESAHPGQFRPTSGCARWCN